MALKLLKKYGIKVYSPTYKRAGKVDAINIFGEDLILACHKFEAEEYKKAYPNNEILELPDDLQKNMAKVRNFILESCPSDYIIMVDDDVSQLLYIEDKEQQNIDHLEQMIIDGFNLANGLNTKLWGLNLLDDPKAYRVYTPFSLQSPILGPFTAVIRSNIRYDERLSLNEDFDFFLQHVFQYRKTLRFNKYSYRASHLNKKGGCGAYRLMTDEVKQSQVMKKKWGKKIVRYDFNKSTNPRVLV